MLQQGLHLLVAGYEVLQEVRRQLAHVVAEAERLREGGQVVGGRKRQEHARGQGRCLEQRLERAAPLAHVVAQVGVRPQVHLIGQRTHFRICV